MPVDDAGSAHARVRLLHARGHVVPRKALRCREEHARDVEHDDAVPEAGEMVGGGRGRALRALGAVAANL